MEQNDKFAYAKIKISIKTPCFIGSGDALKAKEYLYDRSTGSVYFLNKHAWQQFIMEKNLFNNYASFMENGQGGLLEWLKKQGCDLNSLKAVPGLIRTEIKADPDTDKETLNDIHFHARQTDGSIYLPGSTLKGFWRTAILHKLLSAGKPQYQGYWQQIQKLQQQQGKIDKELGYIANDLERALVHKLNLKEKDKPLEPKALLTSAMRGLFISDALPANEAKTIILQKFDVAAGTGEARPLPLSRECVLPGSEFECAIKIDKAMLRTIGFSSVQELLASGEAFADYLTQTWRRAFHGSERYFNADSNIFLGGGTGFHTKTLLLALAPDQKAANTFISALLHKQFRKRPSSNKDEIIAPHTLKITKWRNQEYLMGCAKAEIIP